MIYHILNKAITATVVSIMTDNYTKKKTNKQSTAFKKAYFTLYLFYNYLIKNFLIYVINIKTIYINIILSVKFLIKILNITSKYRFIVILEHTLHKMLSNDAIVYEDFNILVNRYYMPSRYHN